MKPIELPQLGLAGKYRMEVLRPDGSVRFDSGWQDNLITNAGLDAYATINPNNLSFSCLQVGAGNTAPQFTDTALSSFLAGIRLFNQYLGDDNSGYNNVSPRYYWDENTVTFAVGAVVGNVAELGLASATTGGTLFSRALVKDANGDPITVSVQSDEQLRVTYQIRYYLNESTATFDLDLVEWSGTVTTKFSKIIPGTAASGFFGERAYEAGAWPIRRDAYFYQATSVLGADINSRPTGSGVSINSGGSFVGSYVNGSYQRTVRLTLTTAQGNASGGIGAMVVTFVGHGTRQFQFTPFIPKDSNKKLYLDFLVSWGRYNGS